MIILALDCATKTGWALADDGELVESGVEDFSLRRGESPGMRFLRFRTFLTRIRAVYPNIRLVAYELAHHRGGAPTEIGVGFSTRCQEFAVEIGAECVGVHTGTLKKRTTGNGAAKKPEMMAAARRHWGVDVLDDNHGDALCLLALAIEDYDSAFAKVAVGARW